MKEKDDPSAQSKRRLREAADRMSPLSKVHYTSLDLALVRDAAYRASELPQAEPSKAMVEAGAREAFFTDDAGGHIRGGHTWDTIPEVGRENYRTIVRAVLHAALRAAEGEGRQQEPMPLRRTFPNPDNRDEDDGIGLLGGAPRW